MIDLNGAPQSGRILAYAPDRLVYDIYHVQNGEIFLHSSIPFDWNGIYELHLFDTDTEFRMLVQGGKWSKSLMNVSEEKGSDDDHFVFSEVQFVQERYWLEGPNEKIIVNNRFSFDEEGFLRLTGYRLATETAL